MNEQVKRPMKSKKAPAYITDEELKREIQAVKIRVTGEYFKRGENRKDVYEAPFEAEIIVPKNFNGGHVKLQANRYVTKFENGLNGVRVREFFIDADFVPEPVKDKKYVVKDFISDRGLSENEFQKTNYMRKVQAARDKLEAEQDGSYIPDTIEVASRFTNDHNFSIPE